jgi:hypothetical protein
VFLKIQYWPGKVAQVAKVPSKHEAGSSNDSVNNNNNNNNNKNSIICRDPIKYSDFFQNKN